nr:Toll/interleukin-1 receptor (TIR) domain-containing protein [Tanacetum cinerariifolium]
VIYPFDELKSLTYLQDIEASGFAGISASTLAGGINLSQLTMSLKWSNIGTLHMTLVQTAMSTLLKKIIVPVVNLRLRVGYTLPDFHGYGLQNTSIIYAIDVKTVFDGNDDDDDEFEIDTQTVVDSDDGENEESLHLPEKIYGKILDERSFHIPTPALDEVCEEYFSSMKEKDENLSTQFQIPAYQTWRFDQRIRKKGEDTRNNFVGHLYHALEQKGIKTYRDDKKIEQGKTIKDQLIKSIEDSRFYIIVFSKTYASSSWCLDELVKIMECQKTPEQTAYPVFYDVEPTHVRNKSGPCEEAFPRHENEEAAGKWIDAMKNAANLAGWELNKTANRDEYTLIEIIVDVIFKELCSTNRGVVDGKLVGMEMRIKDVLSSLKIGTTDVRMIGIKGMGGGGKTTLARAIYDQISIHFDASSFVENVSEVSKSSLYGLNMLQQQVISNVSKKEKKTICSVHDGTYKIRNTLRGRKVLLVLDDVDNTDQLEALSGDLNWFRSGSRVIITTRDEQVLVAHRANVIHNVNLLSHAEAICLLRRYSFGKDIPFLRYKELSEQVVQYADGLPLTIKVLGSFLCGQNEPQWIDALERLKTIPLKATMEKLEISYIGLEADYKEIFLDVACLLKGWWKEDAIKALESRGFRARNGLRVLEQKSLITISSDGMLGMHDHIEEMGRNIVRRMHPNEPERHSRLWILEEIADILAKDQEVSVATSRLLHLAGIELETSPILK